MEYILINKRVPFIPDAKQIIYIENQYNEIFNNFIKDNYDEIEQRFKYKGCAFIYFPFYSYKVFSRERLLYAMPWSNGVMNKEHPVLPSNCFKQYINNIKEEKSSSHFKFSIFSQVNCTDPCFIRYCGKSGDYYAFEYIALNIKNIAQIGNLVDSFNYDINDFSICCYQIARLSADNYPDFESLKLMMEIKARIEQLRYKGVDELIIRGLLDKDIKLSRIHITKYNRIFLPDYHNMEIEMTPLPKAVFFLFLSYEEGIAFKDLPDYRNKLNSIYEKLTGRSNDAAIKRSIEDVTDPTKNSINEKCARIREAFIQNFDETIARNYFITGQRGEPKKIILPRNLVEWEK